MNTSSFDYAKQFAMAISAIGVLLLLSHLAGQLREGAAPDWTLVVGTGSFVVGLISALLFAICARLQRIEALLSESLSSSSASPGETESVGSAPRLAGE